VFDSDGDRVVELLKKYAGEWKKHHLAINIAIDEGGTWLMQIKGIFLIISA